MSGFVKKKKKKKKGQADRESSREEVLSLLFPESHEWLASLAVCGWTVKV